MATPPPLDPAREARRERAAERQRIARERERSGRNLPWRRRLRIARRSAGDLLLRWFGPTLVRIFARSWRIEQVERERFEALCAGPGFLGALWHGRMLLGLPFARGRGLDVLVSPSDDGSLVTRVLTRFGYRVIRGSTNKLGVRAMHAMRERLRSGGAVVITPDGPRGPRHSMNTGLAWLARETALPILPVGFACNRAWRLHSWDRFTIPKLFARVAVVYAEPLHVDPEADDEELEHLTEQIRERMQAAEREGFRRLGCDPDF